jgi:hypothetical protein
MKKPKPFVRVGEYVYRLATKSTTTIIITYTADYPIRGNGKYIAALDHVNGRPYHGEYDDLITSSETAPHGHEALRKLAEQWARAGFLD